MWQRCNTSVAIGSISASQLSPTPLAPITWSWSQSNRGIGLRARNTLRYWHWEGTPWPQHCALVLVSLVSTQPPVQLPTVIASHRMKVNGQKNRHHLHLHQKFYFDRGGYIKEIHKGCYNWWPRCVWLCDVGRLRCDVSVGRQTRCGTRPQYLHSDACRTLRSQQSQSCKNIF